MCRQIGNKMATDREIDFVCVTIILRKVGIWVLYRCCGESVAMKYLFFVDAINVGLTRVYALCRQISNMPLHTLRYDRRQNGRLLNKRYKNMK